ncbi:hypothetical protein EC604_28915 [Paenibacillus amylolyticus]|uniref:Uncharacterized protein n=1 Tax=Paenibacillus amylolyticus TaxID=1451 RepID=A0A5M9X321_PAEAM|nr:hypothetical protein [Paenibacillus amylolyticus]KAA8787848.1 hypothetical protein EC604_28915 [Paenibacillus amylolyticus]
MERTKMNFNCADANEIVVEGNSEIFGGVDLQIQAITAMLENLNFKFAYDHVGPDYADQSFLRILEALGSALKAEGVYPDGISNMEAVQYYLKFTLDQES